MTAAFKMLGFEISEESEDITYLTFSNPDAGIGDVLLESGDAQMTYMEVEYMAELSSLRHSLTGCTTPVKPSRIIVEP